LEAENSSRQLSPATGYITQNDFGCPKIAKGHDNFSVPDRFFLESKHALSVQKNAERRRLDKNQDAIVRVAFLVRS
jgi:hypothetical protein